jgi:hypothetical protein
LAEGGSKGRHGNRELERVLGGRKRDEGEGGRKKQEKGKGKGEKMEDGAEPVFLNVYGAQESIPRNEFRQPM